MVTGKIKRLVYPRGFGFIESPEGKDLFFHCSGVEGDFEDLKEGDLVTYETEEGPKGLKAVKVQKIEEKKEEESAE